MTTMPASNGLLLLINSFVRENRLDYVLLTSGDFYWDLHENGAWRLLRKRSRTMRSPRGQLHAAAVSIFQFTP
jgi:hypothetical protein